MLEDTLVELINQFQSLAPDIWKVLVTQVYFEAIAKVFWGFFFFLVSWFIHKNLFLKEKKRYEEKYDDGEFYKEESSWWIVLSGIFFALGILFVSNALMWFANPKFYAIRYIIEQITY